jgi:hypothetical protein
MNMNMNMTNSSLQIFQPMNIVVFLSVFSPIIITMVITSLSLFFQNFKGFLYLAYVIFLSFIRGYVYSLFSSSKPFENDGTICTSVQYSKYGNSTFSAFIFAFTLMYLSLPMFINNIMNFWIYFTIVVYFFIDVFIKLYKGCIQQISSLFVNILLGALSACLIVSIMYGSGGQDYLFFNEIQTDKEMCSMPSKQTFKCSVYKNGELVGTI